MQRHTTLFLFVVFSESELTDYVSSWSIDIIMLILYVIFIVICKSEWTYYVSTWFIMAKKN